MGRLPDNSDARERLEEEILNLETASTDVKRPSLPKVTLELMKYNAPTDESLEQTAKSELDDYRDKNIASIREKSETEKTDLSEKRENYGQALTDEMEKLTSAYKNAKDNIDMDVLRRGLARSTIAVNKKGELESEYAGRVSDVDSEYARKIADIDAQISGVGKKLNDALNDFNLTYIFKLNEKLEALKSERDKKIAEVAKYNNDVKAKQAALDESRLKAESKLYSEAIEREKKSETDPEAKQKAVYKSVYDRMFDFLSSMTKEQARLEIRNHTLYRDHLSDYYYYKLYDRFGR